MKIRQQAKWVKKNGSFRKRKEKGGERSYEVYLIQNRGYCGAVQREARNSWWWEALQLGQDVGNIIGRKPTSLGSKSRSNQPILTPLHSRTRAQSSPFHCLKEKGDEKHPSSCNFPWSRSWGSSSSSYSWFMGFLYFPFPLFLMFLLPKRRSLQFWDNFYRPLCG